MSRPTLRSASPAHADVSLFTPMALPAIPVDVRSYRSPASFFASWRSCSAMIRQSSS